MTPNIFTPGKGRKLRIPVKKIIKRVIRLCILFLCHLFLALNDNSMVSNSIVGIDLTKKVRAGLGSSSCPNTLAIRDTPDDDAF